MVRPTTSATCSSRAIPVSCANSTLFRRTPRRGGPCPANDHRGAHGSRALRVFAPEPLGRGRDEPEITNDVDPSRGRSTHLWRCQMDSQLDHAWLGTLERETVLQPPANAPA